MTLFQSSGPVIKSHAEILQEEQRTRARKRQEDLSEQRSALNTPEQRIRIWERLHGLCMPLDPEHPVLDIIAISTRLTLDEVQQEQRAKAERAKSRDSAVRQ